MKKSVYKLLGLTLSGMVLCGLSTVSVSADALLPTSIEDEKTEAARAENQPVANDQVQEKIGLAEEAEAQGMTEIKPEEAADPVSLDNEAAASEANDASAPAASNASEVKVEEDARSASPAASEASPTAARIKAFAAGVIQVSTEMELREAIENSTGPVTIELISDITITDPYPDYTGLKPPSYPAMEESSNKYKRAMLFIASGKDITLTGAHKLIGTGNAVINVNGRLTLDGATITASEGNPHCTGIVVGDTPTTVAYMDANPPAYLHIKSGEISGNSRLGVWVNYGDFLMTGGKIRGNGGLGAYTMGGGIYFDRYPLPAGVDREKYTRSAIIEGGEIYENKADMGGGIFLQSGPRLLEVKGGLIYNNEAEWAGGGIVSGWAMLERDAGGTSDPDLNRSVILKITGGQIYGNKSGWAGGGVYSYISMDMTGGAIYGNTAEKGGGIYCHSYAKSPLNVYVSGGEIRDNTATDSGGGIYTTYYTKLAIGKNAKFSGNKASKLAQVSETDENFATYREKILTPDGKWSVHGIKYGYNNYDINYDGLDLEIISLTFLSGEGGSLSGVTEYPYVVYGTLFGEIPLPEPQAAEGYEFAGWSPQLPEGTEALTASATYTALFVKKPAEPAPTPDDIELPPPAPDPVPTPSPAPVPEPEPEPEPEPKQEPKVEPAPAPKPATLADLAKLTSGAPAAVKTQKLLPATGEKEDTLRPLLGLVGMLAAVAAYKLRGKHKRSTGK